MTKATLTRILSSQKAAYAMVPTAANFVLGSTGFDITQPAVLVLDLAFAALFVAQWALDLRWGSPSDGTGTFSEPTAPPAPPAP